MRRLTAVLTSLALTLSVTVAVAPAAEAATVRAVAIIYQHANYGGAYKHMLVEDAGDCDSAGYTVYTPSPIDFGTSSIGKYWNSPRCNFVVLAYRPNGLSWVTCYSGGWLPLAYVGATCNDEKLRIRIRYVSRTDAAAS